jgi:hypothetical protein
MGLQAEREPLAIVVEVDWFEVALPQPAEVGHRRLADLLMVLLAVEKH